MNWKKINEKYITKDLFNWYTEYSEYEQEVELQIK